MARADMRGRGHPGEMGRRAGITHELVSSIPLTRSSPREGLQPPRRLRRIQQRTSSAGHALHHIPAVVIAQANGETHEPQPLIAQVIHDGLWHRGLEVIAPTLHVLHPTAHPLLSSMATRRGVTPCATKKARRAARSRSRSAASIRCPARLSSTGTSAPGAATTRSLGEPSTLAAPVPKGGAAPPRPPPQ